MPKRVDHDERRRQVARAVWRIAATEGLEAVSMRRVAGVAGFSAPLVQHYFPDKNTMLRFALTELTESAARRAEERVSTATATVHGSGDPGSVGGLLRALLAEFLPLDEERRTLLLVHMAYFTRALSDEALAVMFRDTSPDLMRFVAGQISAEQAAGRAPAGADPEREADSLLTLAVGLGTDMLVGGRTAEAALALIDYHLDRLLGPLWRNGEGEHQAGQGKE